jgi:hypothetical protein
MLAERAKNAEPPFREAVLKVGVSHKALKLIEDEAKVRRITSSKLVLAALFDYLGRGASKPLDLNQPTIFYFPPRLQVRLSRAAKERGVSLNKFVAAALREHLRPSSAIGGEGR